MDPLADIKTRLSTMSKAETLNLLVNEFIRISGLKRATGGNYKYNGALHALYAEVQNILNTPISGSTGVAGFVGLGQIKEPLNTKYWNDINSYESWMFAELTAFANRAPAKLTKPKGGDSVKADHDAFMNLLVRAKAAAIARLSSVAVKSIAPSGVGLVAANKPLSLAIAISLDDKTQEPALLAKLNAELAATPYDERALLQKWTNLPPDEKTRVVNLLLSATTAKDVFTFLMIEEPIDSSSVDRAMAELSGAVGGRRLQSRRKYKRKVRNGRLSRKNYGQNSY
jgi:hypothetical protein